MHRTDLERLDAEPTGRPRQVAEAWNTEIERHQHSPGTPRAKRSSSRTATRGPGASIESVNYDALPGGDLVRQGLADLGRRDETVAALLVSIGAPRLRRIGIPVPERTFRDPEHRLYLFLAAEDSDSAHSRYNAWVGRLVSFENAAECVS